MFEVVCVLWFDVLFCMWIVEEDGVVFGLYYLKVNVVGLVKYVSNCGYMVNEVVCGCGVVCLMCEYL